MFSFSFLSQLAFVATLGAVTLSDPFTAASPFIKLGVLSLGLMLGVVITERNTDRKRSGIREAESGDVRPKRALIVGAGSVGRSLADSLEADGTFCVVGFVDDDASAETRGRPILGTRDDTAVVVRRHDVDEVFVAFAPTWQQKVAEELAASSSDVRLNIVPSPFESMLGAKRMEHVGEIAFVRLDVRPSRLTRAAKRLFDIASASAGLILFLPLMGLLALLIKRESRGPAIFAQERVGRYGREFVLYKFRTMVPDAEASTGPVLADGMGDSRLTGIGRRLKVFRLDELPQLWNVIKGDMSLVGPRPERPCFVHEFERLNPTYARRHDVRPGITGLAQVCGGYHTDWRDKLRFDLHYVARQSVILDLKILVKTLLLVLRGSHK